MNGYAGFYNQYDDIYTVELANPPAPLPYTIQNGLAGQSWGAELSGTYQPVAWWRWRGGYTYFHKDLWNQPGHSFAQVATLGNDPEHQFVLQSMLNLPAHIQFDVTARYVDTLPNPRIPNYLTFDARLAWEFKNIELAVVGQDLCDNQHPEFMATQQVPRSIYGKVTWRF